MNPVANFQQKLMLQQQELNAYDQEKDKYYFIPLIGKSYRLEKLVLALYNKFSENQQNFKNKEEPKSPYCILFPITPGGRRYGYGSFAKLNMTKGVKSLLKMIRLVKASEIFLDQSRSSNEKECPVSFEAFETSKSYILNLNGRTYSEQAVHDLIKTTLFADQPCNLEDMTLDPSMLSDIVFYPNRSLSKQFTKHPKELKFRFNEIKIKEFNLQNAKILPNFTKDINNYSTYESFYNFYAQLKGISLFKGLKHTIYDLVIKGVKIFSKPLQWGNEEGYLTFSNILFEDCSVKMKNCKDIRIKSSCFVNCKIDLRDVFFSSLPFRKTKLVNCKILVHSGNPFPIVERLEDLQNCTLEILRNK